MSFLLHPAFRSIVTWIAKLQYFLCEMIANKITPSANLQANIDQIIDPWVGHTERFITEESKKIGEERLQQVASQLLEYCRNSDWAGYDPYDALNSEVFKRLAILNSRWPRIVLTQLLKRSPVNLRRILHIPKTQNPKALGLFLRAAIKLEWGINRDKVINELLDRIIAARSPDSRYWCWGYSFPWQGRLILAPRGAANLVCTVFVADALIDVYELNGNSSCLDMAKSAAEYILGELYWEDGDAAGFSYPLPALKARVHNANFLGAALACRVYMHTEEDKFLGPALKVSRYSASKQHEAGSWDYGETPGQRWIDNFHTGYNLCALKTIESCLQTNEFSANIRRGYEFFKKNFFRRDGAPKYYHNRVYPIDIHSVAQSIVTLCCLKQNESDMTMADAVLSWSLKKMRHRRGYFYYQDTPLYKNRIPYMRWSQAWMLYALSTRLSCMKAMTVNG